MDKNSAPPTKIVKNPLLQTANYGFPLDSLLSNSLVVPVPKEDTSTLSESTEIDSFIGQESTAPESVVPLNSIVNESSPKSSSQESVPLVVPGSSTQEPPEPSTTFSRLPTTQSLFADAFATDTTSSFFPSSTTEYSPFPAFTPPKSVPAAQFFNPSQFEGLPSSSGFQPPSSGSVVPPLATFTNPFESGNVAPTTSGPPTSLGLGNSYRLGNLKRPTYAPVPGLSSTSNVNQQQQQQQSPPPLQPPSFPIFTPPSPPPQLSDFVNQTSPSPADMSKSSGSPSPVGPYHNTTTLLNANSSKEKPSAYRSVYHHWFYCKETEKAWFFNQKEVNIRSQWKPFSMADSLALEKAYNSPTLSEETIVPTDGARYDVNVVKREKISVYWEERKNLVRRCSWFYKGVTDSYFMPYEEEVAAKLEEEYKKGVISGLWNRKIDLGNEEVVMHNVSLITHQIKSANLTIEVMSDSSIPSQLKPRMVKRGGYDDFDIDDGEPEKVDHLLFLVHGVGQFCDLKFRSIIEVVDEFRNISLQLTQSHFQESCELGEVNKIEILPVSWHKALHGQDTGVDQRLKTITLPSIPRLRDFSNDTILDILFYTSPVFCQIIVNSVVNEMNRMYALFLERHPGFTGKVSLGGHSLGSLIVFDILSNQPTTLIEENEPEITPDITAEYTKSLTKLTRRISVVTIGKAGTGQPLVKYPKFNFNPRFFFAFGSPIAGYVATRSNEILGEDFKFPTCKGFFNIYHPYDPIAYRIEPLIIPSLSTVKPVQVPHHKGRKRMHLELKDTVSHVGQRLIDTVKNTWNMVYHLAVNKSVDAAESVIQREINQVLQAGEEFSRKPINTNLVPGEPLNEITNMKVGNLNEGKRVDYVLQEAPVEYFNEYLFALASHLCYWTSRDTMLLVLREIYGDIGVYTDNQVPQTILPFDITDSANENGDMSSSTSAQNTFKDPTSPIGDNPNLGPPPKTGFVKK